MTTWRSLFERGAAADTDEEEIRTTLDAVRAERRDSDTSTAESTDRSAQTGTEPPDEPLAPEPKASSPSRVVADADVLVADLLVGGPARDALDHLRRHSWMTLVVSDVLLAEAEAVTSRLTTEALATDWRERVEEWREAVSHPPDDSPALASAYRGGAMHLLTFDHRLQSANAGTALRGRVPVSVRSPDAFARLFDPESLYAEVGDGEYEGPDRDPRA